MLHFGTLHHNVSGHTQYLSGTDGNETFVIEGLSTDFGWAPTDDGKGIVVWGDNDHNILWNFDYIRFDNGYVKLGDAGLTFVAETPWNDPVEYGQVVENKVGQAQYLRGSDETNTFVIDGNSFNYGWGNTDDGTGLVIWTREAGADESNILWDYDYVRFNDGRLELSDNAPIFVPAEGFNRAPVGVEDMATTDVNTAVTIDVLANDIDLDGDTLSIHEYHDGENGTVTLNADGTLTYTPNDGFVGTDYFHYCVTDGKGGVDGTTVKVVIEEGEIPEDASIGDFVWHDQNGNGVQDLGEAGLAGVKVELLDANGTVVSETRTASNGFYLFENLRAGQYRVRVEEVDGFDFTEQGVGNNELIDSNVDEDTGVSELITITSGEYNGSIDAGLVTETGTACIGDRVWHDENGNGIQDNGEAGFANVRVDLLDANGNQIATTTTDANGQYLFHNLDAGQYRVRFGEVTDYDFTAQDQGNNEEVDSDANQTTGITDIINLADDENRLDIDAGLVKEDDPEPELGSIGDRVFIDANKNGRFNTGQGETGAANVTVHLLNAAGTRIATTTTDANGFYKFDDLEAGDYRVQVEAPDGFEFTRKDIGNNDRVDSDVDQTTGITDVISLSEGQHIVTVDAGLIKEEDPEPELGSIGDRVFIDTNENGRFNVGQGEAGAANVTVHLLNAAGTRIATTTTDANGFYKFDDLEAGDYRVQVEAPDGYNFTRKDVGTNDRVDSDVDQTTGITDVITLAEGQHIDTVDAGLIKEPELELGSIGDRVWLDANRNGIQDAGEEGIAGVELTLKDENGNVIDTTTTDANGNYLFDDLEAGKYSVGIVTPECYHLTVKDGKYGEARKTSGTPGQLGFETDADGISVNKKTGWLFFNNGKKDTTNEVAVNIDIGGKKNVFEQVDVEIKVNGVLFDTSGRIELVDIDGNVVDEVSFHRGTTHDTTTGKVFHLTGTGEGLFVRAFDTTTHDASAVYYDHWSIGPIKITSSKLGDAPDDKDSDFDTDTNWTHPIDLQQGEDRTDIDAGLFKNTAPVANPDYFQDHLGDRKQDLIGNRVAIDVPVLKNDFDPDGDKIVIVDVKLISSSLAGAQVEIIDGGHNVRISWPQSNTTRGEDYNVKFEYTIEDEYGKQDTTTAHVSGKLYSPVALDLNSDGEIGVTGETTSRDKDADAELGRTVEFDIDADGKIETIEWFDGSGDGILVDMTKIGEDGSIDGSALFGDEGGKFANGYEKLALHDANGDGVISGEELEGLGVWIDDGDAVLEAGELKSAAEAGITSINSDFEIEYDEAGRSYIRSEAEVDGKTVLTEDVWFAADQSADIVEQVKSDEDDQMLANAGTEECVFCAA